MYAQRMSRRTALRLAVAGAETVVASACTPTVPAAAPAVAKQTPQPAAAQPRSGGTLRLGIPADIASLCGPRPKVATGTYVNQANWFTTADTPDKYDTWLAP